MSAAPAARSAAARVAAAAPDGYTLLAGSMGSHVAAPVLTPNIKYDSARDFVPIGFTAHSPAVIVARKDFPAKDLREFVAYVKKNGDSVKQAHGGIGASSHMACLLFNARAGAEADAGRLSRHRPGDERPDRRPRRFLLRAVGERRRADHGRHDQGLRGLGRRAARRAARRADREGGRARLPDEHLGRHLRAQGHAEGRSSTSSPPRSTRRSTTTASSSASTTSAARSPRRASAPRRRSTPS